jgi:Fe-S oxidoreductase
MISGRTIAVDEVVDAVFESLSMCLACKGCKAECPSAVDVAKLKYEFMNKYYYTHRRPLRDYLFGYIGEVAAFGRLVRPAANFILRGKPGKTLLSILGISPERSLPAIVPKGRVKTLGEGKDYDVTEEVIFLSDPFSEYFTPELIRDAASILKVAGCHINFLPVIGAGRTKLSKGFLPQVRKHAMKVSAAIKKIDPDGVMPIIGIEPSEIAMLTDDLLSFLPDDDVLRASSLRTYSLEEFLLRPGEDNTPRIGNLKVRLKSNLSILLHGHCHQKAQSLPRDGYPIGVAATVEVLNSLGAEVEVIQSGCCGMAGAFGYEADYIEMSKQVAEYALLPAIRGKKDAQIVVAPGASCRAQIESLAGEEVIHPITLIASITT